jgi:hypothetical protein
MFDRGQYSACPVCGCRLNDGPNAAPANFRAAVRPKIQCEVCLGVTVDRTGSSEAFKKGIPEAFEIASSSILGKASSMRVWLQSHGDLDEGQQPMLHADGVGAQRALDAIRAILYEGGGDPPEHHFDAIENLLNTVPWPSDARRARGGILAFTTADSKPARSGKSARQLGEEIRRRELLLYLVSEPTPSLYELTEAAHGQLFEISNNPDPHEFQEIASELARSIVVTIASGKTDPLVA